jgi:hypothetical protein
MMAILSPILFGLLAFVGAGIVLWFPGSLLFVPLFGVALLPAVVLIPSFLIGGFVAGKKAKTERWGLKVGMGATVGASAILIFLLISHSSVVVWLIPLMLLGGAILGGLGAFMSAKVK